MNFDKRGIGIDLTLLAVLIIGLAAYIGRWGPLEGLAAMGATTPAGEPVVAYGASLSEWEEATQDESTQTTSGSAEETEWPFPQNDDEPTTENTSTEGAAEEAVAEEATDADEEVLFELDNVVYRQIMWDGLIPANFTAEAIMAKYQEELASIQDGSPEASELYTKMQEEFNSAPVNEIINEVEVRLPGFIAPLNYTDDLITEFLLVPYFGACIHVPPPPANQTVLVTTAEGHGIKMEDSNTPIWVMGKIVTEGATTDLAAAGYNIENAIIEPYENLQ